MTNKNEKIETVDENGNKVCFDVLDIVTVDDVDYAILLPEDGEDEESELLIMRLKQDGEEYLFETIDDDEEFEKVAAYIEEIEDETEE
ncbi:MAG: DUF1292 domain-containing protein [Candidatus Avigastranaerophilus sp.]